MLTIIWASESRNLSADGGSYLNVDENEIKRSAMKRGRPVARNLQQQTQVGHVQHQWFLAFILPPLKKGSFGPIVTVLPVTWLLFGVLCIEMPTSPSQFDTLSFQACSCRKRCCRFNGDPSAHLSDRSPPQNFYAQLHEHQNSAAYLWYWESPTASLPQRPWHIGWGPSASVPGTAGNGRSQSPIQQGAPTVVRNCSRSRSQLLSAMDRTLLKGTAWELMGRTPKPDLELKKACWRNRPLSRLSES